MEMRHSGLYEQFGIFFLLNTTDKDASSIIWDFNYSSKTGVILFAVIKIIEQNIIGERFQCCKIIHRNTS